MSSPSYPGNLTQIGNDNLNKYTMLGSRLQSNKLSMPVAAVPNYIIDGTNGIIPGSNGGQDEQGSPADLANYGYI